MDRNLTSSDYVETRMEGAPATNEAHSSGVSWGAVIGGAFVAAALYLILLALGAGFGLSVISPTQGAGFSGSAAGTAAIVWLIVTSILAFALGGYLTGRLRTKWALIHTDEVFFRDTANGFLAWAVGLVAIVTLLASAAVSMSGGTAQMRAPGEAMDANAYYVDTMFRSDRNASKDVPTLEEAGRIFGNALEQNQISSADQNYLAELIAAKTGITQADAEKRVSDTVAEARQAEDTARKQTAHLLLWLFLSLLIGAFSASYFATIGGRLRDHVKPA